MGLQRETAGRGTMAVYTQVRLLFARLHLHSYLQYLKIVFATILQKIFLKSTPPLLSIVGTLIILGSALYTAVRCIMLLWSLYLLADIPFLLA